jgi:hypothetical protein
MPPCSVTVLDLSAINQEIGVGVDSCALIYGARYCEIREVFGGKGFYIGDPKDLHGASTRR